ncbi:MAG TPA: transglycosylase SLT domain-containing protein [Blastocatellia bacterium]
MFYRLSNFNHRIFRRRAMALPLMLALFSLMVPLTASCQRAQGGNERGIEELRALVANSAGRPSVEALSQIESKHSGTRAAALARFLRGYLYAQSQNHQAAVDALDASRITAACSLGDYALFYRAESEIALNSRSSARRDYTELYSKFADSLRARESRLRAAETAVSAGDPTAAIKDLSQMAEDNDADALFITAQAYESMGRNEEAIKIYRRIYYELPATAASVRVEERLAALGAALKDNPGSFDELRSRADALFEAKQYGEAAAAFDIFLTVFPDAERMDEVQLRRGVSLLGARQPAQAVLPLSKVGSRNADFHAEALFNLAEALRLSNRASESAVVVDRLIQTYPKNRRAQEALYDLATYLNKRNRTSEAAARYRQLVAAYPKTAYAAEASYQLGWQAYKSKNYADCARILEQHLLNHRYPDTKYVGEAALWAGKSEELLGNKSRALALYQIASERYPYGYHGYIAGLRANRLRAASPGLKAEAAAPGSDLERMRNNALHVEKIQETASGSESARLARAADLELIGLGDLAIREFNSALATAPNSPRINLLLAQFYSRRGDPYQATLILRRGYPDIYSYKEEDVPREAWEIFFPLLSWETIKQEAKKYGIDPYTVAGLIRQESVFNPNAVSRVGARGLMQVMLGTGRPIARRQGVGDIAASDLLNPDLNIKLGMNYLAQMLGQFGRIEYAAAAYNAGPGRARQWIAERGTMDIEDWIETIPFTETRGYVQGVLRYAANYRRLYKE